MRLYVRFKNKEYIILEEVSNYTLYSSKNIYIITFDNGRSSMISADSVLYIGYCEDLWCSKKGE